MHDPREIPVIVETPADEQGARAWARALADEQAAGAAPVLASRAPGNYRPDQNPLPQGWPGAITLVP